MRLLLSALLLSLGLLASCGGGGGAPSTDFTLVTVSDPANGDTFMYRSPDTFAYALAPLAGDAPTAAEGALLAAVNAERARGGACPGGQTFSARAALKFEGHLYRSARGYAGVLAASGNLTLPHKTGSSTPARRMTGAGYVPAPPKNVVMHFEESLAGGSADPAQVISDWKTSVGHCAALYSAVPHGAVARADGPLGAYWVLNTAGW